MKIIGVTGPSGSGKSLLCQRLSKKGFSVIDADDVYHKLLIPPSDCIDALRGAFGNTVFKEDGTLDRKALSEIVFHDEEKLNLLNTTVHGFVLDKIRKMISELEENGCSTVAVDAPTLIESGFHKECHTVLTVLCPPEIRTERIMARDGISAEAARTRTLAQKPDSFYIEHSDFVLTNRWDEKNFELEIDEVIDKL